MPPLPQRPNPHSRADRKNQARPQRPLPRHIRQSLPRDQPRREDPHIPRRHLEQLPRHLIHIRIQLIHAGANDGAHDATNQLSVELGLGGGAEEVAGLEVLHEVAGLQGAGLGDGAGEEVDDDGVGVGGRDEEGEEELG